MLRARAGFVCVGLLLALGHLRAAEPAAGVPGAAVLDWSDPIDVRIVDEAHALLDRKTAESVAARTAIWQRDVTSPEAYAASLAPNRARFQAIIGTVDPHVPPSMERWGDDRQPALVAETSRYRVYQVRWPLFEDVWGEGILLEPATTAIAQVVALADADQTPEQLVGLAAGIAPESQFARRLAENGFRVVVPVLIDRACTFSGKRRVAMTNQPHREWIYRQAYELGRHVIGYDVQKTLAAVDWFESRRAGAADCDCGLRRGRAGGLLRGGGRHAH